MSSNDLLVLVGFMVGSVALGFAGLWWRGRVTASARAAFHARCAAVGFAPLEGGSALHVAGGGEVHGRRVVLMLVTVRSRGVPLGPRLDVLVETGLGWLPGGGGALVRPRRQPEFQGPSEARAALTAALGPPVLALARAKLGGRLALSSLDTLQPGATFRRLVESRWKDGWRGVLLQTWLPLDADEATLRSTLDAAVEVREALVQATASVQAP